jgi:hypothetical protein
MGTSVSSVISVSKRIYFWSRKLLGKRINISSFLLLLPTEVYLMAQWLNCHSWGCKFDSCGRKEHPLYFDNVNCFLSTSMLVFPSASVSVFLPVYLYVCLSVYLPVCLTCLSDRLPACLFVSVCVCISVCMSICPPACLLACTICLSVNLFLCYPTPLHWVAPFPHELSHYGIKVAGTPHPSPAVIHTSSRIHLLVAIWGGGGVCCSTDIKLLYIAVACHTVGIQYT